MSPESQYICLTGRCCGLGSRENAPCHTLKPRPHSGSRHLRTDTKRIIMRYGSAAAKQIQTAFPEEIKMDSCKQSLTLVVMAAGMGSRYGGLKQIDPVDEAGHIIMDFSIYDAILAGFDRVIFIIKKENEQLFKEAIGDRISRQIPVTYVFQELSNIPEPFKIPEGRQKPWGTGHAVLSCIDVLDGPFAVINADDFYGRQAFALAAEFLQNQIRHHSR